ADSATLAYLLFNFCFARETLAVPKIHCSLFTSLNFDRGAFSLSLHRPPDAVKFKAADSATLAYLLFNFCFARETLAVSKIHCSLFASLNFDRGAFSLSLHRPPDAVKLKAADSATLAYCCLPSLRMPVYYIGKDLNCQAFFAV
ncbi:MAG: hypothetical protein IJ262_05400, partial [Clostridia bacterium]|nr:hypothetical protein [Clostridia bacterium]